MGLLPRTLALVTLGLLIVFAGFVMLSAQSIRDSARRSLEERLLIAGVTARDLGDRLLQIATVASLEAARLPTVGGDRTEETRAAWRALRLQFGPMVQRVVAIDTLSRVQWTSPFSQDLLGIDLSSVPAVSRAMQSSEIVIDESDSLNLPAALLGPAPNPTVSLFSPIRSDKGGLVLIILDLNQHGMVDVLNSVVLGQTGYTDIVARDGRVVASSDPHRPGMMSDLQGQFATLVAQQKSMTGTCPDCRQDPATGTLTEEVVAFAPLARAPLGVALRQSSSEAFAFEDALLQRTLLFGAVAFAIALVVSWIIVVRLVRPVKVLTSACLRIAEGDLSQPVQPMGGCEIGILASSFETMRARLKASQEEIRRWGHELEQKVSERTAQLEEARDSLERSRDFLATLFDSLEDQLAVIDREYRIVEANRALLQRCGEEGNLLGEPCHLAFRGAAQQCEPRSDVCPAKTVWETNHPSRATLYHVDASGHRTYLDVLASPIRDRHGRVVNVLEVARDVTESKRLEEQVLRNSEELSTLVSLSSTIARSMDLRAMLAVALDHVLGLTGAPSGGILLDAAEGETAPTVVTRNIDPKVIRKLSGEAGPTPEDSTELLRVRRNGYQMLCVPIATGDRELGKMFISCQPGACFDSTSSNRQLLVSIGSQLAVAVENIRLYEAIRQKEKAISSFLRKYIAAQEEERKRIARELHDDTAQSLTALALAIETALQAEVSTASEVKSLLEPARPLAQRIYGEISRIIHDLRPSLLDDLGLTEALGWYADHRLKPLGIQVTLEAPRSSRRLTPELETTLFRVAQEAMSNVAKHAKAENVTISVEIEPDHVALDVDDDGCGFDMQNTLAKGRNGKGCSSFGLLGMRERVNLLGGTLSVESQPGQGTSVRVRIPMQTV